MMWLGMVKGGMGTEYVFKSKGGDLISGATQNIARSLVSRTSAR